MTMHYECWVTNSPMTGQQACKDCKIDKNCPVKEGFTFGPHLVVDDPPNNAKAVEKKST